MRNIEDIAAEEESRARETLMSRLRAAGFLSAIVLSLWGWRLFWQGQLGKGALIIVLSLSLFGAAWGILKVFSGAFSSLAAGVMSGTLGLALYSLSLLPSFYWGKDPSFWLAVHSGTVVEPLWSPLSYLLGQAASFSFPQKQIFVLPQLSSVVMSIALFFVTQEYLKQFKNKTVLNGILGLLVCGLLTLSLPFWNAATLGSGLIASLGLLLFLFQKALLNQVEKPWPGLSLLLGLLWSVHPLWGLLGLLNHLGSLDFEGKKWGRNIPSFLTGLTPYLWISFRADHFFPSWGGPYPFLELLNQRKNLWQFHVRQDWLIGPALAALGWILGGLGFLTVLLLVLNYFKWKTGNKTLFPALNFWVWIFSGAGGLFFFSVSSEMLGPLVLWFAFGLGEIFLKLLEKGIEKRHSTFFSGGRLAVMAAGGIILVFGLVLLPGQLLWRNLYYFPQQHAFNLLQALQGKSVLVCDDSFETAACLEARLIEPVSLTAVILEKKYLNQKWYVAQCIKQAPEFLFSTILGSNEEILRSLLLNNRDRWTIHWARSELPVDWKDLKAFSTVLTQEFEGKDTVSENPENIQYRYDLTALTQRNETTDPQFAFYFFRYVAGFNELGKNLLSQGLYLASIQAFDRALKLEPTYSEPQSYLTQMYSQKNILEAAQLGFEKTIKKHPERITELIKELEEAQVEKNESKSVTVLDEMIRLNSELADAQYQLSVIYNRQGRSQESKALLESSIQLNPKQLEAQMTLGHMTARAGNRIKAEEAFRSVLVMNPENKEAQIELWKLLNKP